MTRPQQLLAALVLRLLERLLAALARFTDWQAQTGKVVRRRFGDPGSLP